MRTLSLSFRQRMVSVALATLAGAISAGEAQPPATPEQTVPGWQIAADPDEDLPLRIEALRGLDISLLSPAEHAEAEDKIFELLRAEKTPEELLFACANVFAHLRRSESMALWQLAAEMSPVAAKLPPAGRAALEQTIRVIRGKREALFGEEPEHWLSHAPVPPTPLMLKTSASFVVPTVAIVSERANSDVFIELGDTVLSTAPKDLKIIPRLFVTLTPDLDLTILVGPPPLTPPNELHLASIPAPANTFPSAGGQIDAQLANNLQDAKNTSPLFAIPTPGILASLPSMTPQNDPQLATTPAPANAFSSAGGQIDAQLANNLLAEARDLTTKKQFAQAQRIYLDLVRLFPNQASTCWDELLSIFSVLSGEGKFSDRAMGDFLTVVKEHTAALLESAEFFLCGAIFKAGDYRKASPTVESFLDRHPTSPFRLRARLLDGMIAVNAGDKDKALTIFGQLAADKNAQEPEIAPKACFLLGWTHLFEQDYAQARKAFEQLIQEYPKSEPAAKARDLLKNMPQSR